MGRKHRQNCILTGSVKLDIIMMTRKASHSIFYSFVFITAWVLTSCVGQREIVSKPRTVVEQRKVISDKIIVESTQPDRKTVAQKNYSPNVLIVFYDNKIGETPLLKEIDKMKGVVIYQYRLSCGLSLRIPKLMRIKTAMKRLSQVAGVTQVMRDSIIYLDPVKPKAEDLN